MDEPELWRWIWLLAAGMGFVGEMLTAGTFFLLPFGLGAAVACLLAFAGTSIAVQWLAFVGVSLAAFAATRPIARRLDASISTEGIGARRWIGQAATVLHAIPAGPDGTGLVRVGREEWRAQSEAGDPLLEGDVVTVVEMRGTRLVVRPIEREEIP